MKHRTQPVKRLMAPQPPADPWAAWGREAMQELIDEEARLDALDAEAEIRARRLNHRRELK